MELDRASTCCFTGHRPGPQLPTEERAKALLRGAILQAAEDGYTAFITGMARGTDLWAAEQLLEEKEAGLSALLICASPFPGFENSWGDRWRLRYRRVLQAADEVIYVSPAREGNGVYQVRNRWMVDHSSRVIALYAGGPGGTWNTVRYALKTGVPLYILRDEEETEEIEAETEDP